MNLNQITIPSIDLNKSIPFYEKLGLRLIVDSRPRYARFELPEGESTFSIHHAENISSGEKPVLYFEVSDLAQTFAELQSKGIKFDLHPVMQRWLWEEAHLTDPDGHQIILFHAGENRKNPPWRLKQ